MKSLVRKLKINEIEPLEFSKTELDIISFINSKISELTEFKMDDYPDFIFYMNSKGEYILEQDKKSNRLWCRYDGFWSILELKYSLKYIDIQSLMHYMVEKAFKMKVSTPREVNHIWIQEVEKAFKMKVSTPQTARHYPFPWVEKAFKMKVSTLIPTHSISV